MRSNDGEPLINFRNQLSAGLMKRSTQLLLLLCIGVSLRCGSGKESLQTEQDALSIARSFITAEDARAHVYFLASDSLMGRKTPSTGLTIAGDYIARQFESFGVKPVAGSYFFDFNLTQTRLGEENYLRTLQRSEKKSFEIKTDFMPFDFTGSKEVSGEVIFVGYGITAPEYEYDDYAGIDARGKILLMLRHEPQENDSTSVFQGTTATKHSQFDVKMRNAIDHGAVGVMLVNDPLNHTSLAPRGFPWPSLYRNIPNNALPLTLSMAEEEKIPFVHVGPSVIEDFFGSVDSLKSIQTLIDLSLRPNSVVLSDRTVEMKVTTSSTFLPARNVVGFVEGSDATLKNEVVIIGAHYDHVGTKDENAEGEDHIYNGADDNASGTAGLIEVAKAFGRASLKPKRSILLIAFAGEELGLLGSEAYARAPLFPLSSTVAMLNMDMIGRNANDSIGVGGVERSPVLKSNVERFARTIGLVLQYNIDQYFYRSDQASFARRNIPVLFFHSGEHPDYHKVTDHADKINTEKLAKIAQLVFLMTLDIANNSARPHYVEAK